MNRRKGILEILKYKEDLKTKEILKLIKNYYILYDIDNKENFSKILTCILDKANQSYEQIAELNYISLETLKRKIKKINAFVLKIIRLF